MEASAQSRHPAQGRSVEANGIRTNYHEAGEGPPLILLHGSGAGVSGWENWHGVMPAFARRHRVLVPDIVGFGFTERQPGAKYNIKVWVQHLLGFMDAMGVERADLVGNSFGGALALAVALRNGHRVGKMVLMGTPAGEFEQRASSARSWYYQPSLENMAELLRTFPYDPAIVTDEMVRLRHEVSLLAGGMDAYRKLFPEPGQAGEVKMVKGIPEEDLASVQAPVLVLHGRDDQRVPVECGLRIARRCPRADLHMFGLCGHWVQIERREAFVELASSFLA
ncbi:2-hydroxy-6-oxo-2,4-heptadienoate hydrolase [Pigmentiphaga sp. NML080357]|uniref:alpha/beta fold hydrolase n=1 Tax=Pigmentiphaga sp. NML080357 TaxID=2008675 RepID=UPI000B4171AC|nr:alpha/beta hydrolase [Pigmentiphaga sp. NML080357]OVZ56880.1 2-hydroxy-6-oxo-2,4-heptadienoate hydrolase [Pigmentiphaga sp. NML080357]